MTSDQLHTRTLVEADQFKLTLDDKMKRRKFDDLVQRRDLRGSTSAKSTLTYN